MASSCLLRPLKHSYLLNTWKRCFKCDFKRDFLSDAYLCKEEWKKRLEEPLLKKFKTNSFYYELDHRFNMDKKISAVDMDIFANGIVDQENLDELEEMIHRFRRTPNTRFATDSLSHAVIRSFLQFDTTEPLMRMLDDRLNYGIFHDHYTANMMMDHFLKKKNYRDAAKVAILLMLQEDFDHPIANQLALYSCHMYLLHPQPEPWNPEAQPTEEAEEDDEEILVRVNYIYEPYTDDHFDMIDPEKLIGKTLMMIGKQENDTISLTSCLIGAALFQKWDKVVDLLEGVKNNPNQKLFKEGVEQFKQILSKAALTENNDAILSRVADLERSGQTEEGTITEAIAKKLADVIAAHEKNDIATMKSLYLKWGKDRQNKIDKQILDYQRRETIKEIANKKIDMKKKEDLLFFFENLEKHRLNIPVDEEDEMINEEGKVSGKSLLEVPPEIEGKIGRYSSGLIEQHDPWWRWKEVKEERLKKAAEKEENQKFKFSTITRKEIN